jgi:XTP/dITP diphosphohydrolase
VEDGDTFAENAAKKAVFVAERTGLPALADDSGLEVDALDGRPGVHSARYAGDPNRESRDAANNRKLLEELRGIPQEKRTARFRCCIAFAVPGENGAEISARSEGKVDGVMLKSPKGEEGFGYDPLFFHYPSGCTFAELPAKKKNQLSHRARALRKIRPFLDRWFSRAGEETGGRGATG